MGAASWAQSAGALVFVLLLVYAAGWLARRSGALRPVAAAPIRTIASVSVGTRERVVIVEAGEQWLVLGVAPGRVNALHTMPAQPLPEAGPAAAPSFAELLKKIRK